MNQFIKTSAIIIFLLLFSTSNIKAQVVINEFLPNAETEWVEFYNASTSADYLNKYYFDDEAGHKKTLLEYALNTDNVKFPYIELNKVLNNSGDKLYLYDQNDQLVDQAAYSQDPGNNTSIGRSPDQTGSFAILETPTKAAPNASKKSTPAPTPKETKAPSPTLQPTPTPERSTTPSPTQKPTTNPKILGKAKTPKPINTKALREELKPDNPEPEKQEPKKRSLAPFFFMGSGSIFLGIAGLPLAKKQYRNYLSKKAKIKSEEEIF